jgi:hypothetical protein
MNTNALAELNVPSDLCEFRRGKLIFLRTPVREEWEQVGRFLSACRQTSIVWLADWRRQGRAAFDETVVEEVERSLQLEFRELKSMEAIEQLEARSAVLNDEHHFVIARELKGDSGKAEEWLRLAETETLSPQELKESIRAGRVVKASLEPSANPKDKSAGLVTIEGISVWYGIWRRKVIEAYGDFEKWDQERLQKVLPLIEQIQTDAGCIAGLIYRANDQGQLRREEDHE